MQVIETKVYTFDELNEEAKEKARSWCREGNDFNLYADCYADGVIDDAKAIGALMGIDIEVIHYQGFYSQGDGACFEGRYSYKKDSVKAVKEYAPKDKELHNIAQSLQDIQKRNFHQLQATVKHSGRYYHAYCTDINVWRDLATWDGWQELELEETTEERIKESLRDFMNWIFNALKNEYEYQNEDNHVDENILANGYTFTVTGDRF